jgi:hypothetical protein
VGGGCTGARCTRRGVAGERAGADARGRAQGHGRGGAAARAGPAGTCDPDDPVARSLARAIEQVELAPPGRPGLLWRARRAARDLYRWLVRRRWFGEGRHRLLRGARRQHADPGDADGGAHRGLAGLLRGGPARRRRCCCTPALRSAASDRPAQRSAALTGVGAACCGAAAPPCCPRCRFSSGPSSSQRQCPRCSCCSASCECAGPGSRRTSTFKTAILIIIFVTQFFTFYHQQLLAVLGLFGNIVIWLTLRAMIHQEQKLVAERSRL